MSCFVLWIAGMMMCDGASPASCTMYSPMSDSSASMPAASITWLSPISSLTIDLPLIIRFAEWRRAMSSTMALASSGVSRPVHAGCRWRRACARAVRAARAGARGCTCGSPRRGRAAPRSSAGSGNCARRFACRKSIAPRKPCRSLASPAAARLRAAKPSDGWSWMAGLMRLLLCWTGFATWRKQHDQFARAVRAVGQHLLDVGGLRRAARPAARWSAARRPSARRPWPRAGRHGSSPRRAATKWTGGTSDISRGSRGIGPEHEAAGFGDRALRHGQARRRCARTARRARRRRAGRRRLSSRPPRAAAARAPPPTARPRRPGCGRGPSRRRRGRSTSGQPAASVSCTSACAASIAALQPRDALPAGPPPAARAA